MPGWIMARLIGGPADGRFVRIFVTEDESSEVYRVLLKLWSKTRHGERIGLGWLIAKYRYSRLSETEHDGSIPIMLYGFVRIER